MGWREVVAAAVLLAVACGGASQPQPASIEVATFATSLGVQLDASTKLANGEYVRDLDAGTGALIAQGQALSMHYSGWLVDGTLFDQNQGADVPFVFRLGNGDVIGGWDQGLDGMRVGGSRQLIIPPSLGYGSQGVSGVIPPNAILVFDVTVVGAR